jgi:hypothetical protein
MLCEDEGGVQFNPEDPVGFRGVDGGNRELNLLMATKCFCNRDARRVQLDSERALSFLNSAPGMQHFRTFTIIPVYTLKRENF